MSTQGWFELGEHGGKMLAFVQPAFRAQFPVTWFVTGGLYLPLEIVEDPFTRHRLMAASESMIGFGADDLRRLDAPTLRARMQDAHESGRLVIVRAPIADWQRHTAALRKEHRERSSSSSSPAAATSSQASTASASPTPPPAPASAAPAPVLPAPTVQKAWITIHLVDDQDQPYPEKDYSLLLPNGRTLTGDLDKVDKPNAIGELTQKEIDPGTCDFTFLKLDHAAWSTVSGGGAESLAIVGGSAKEHVIAEGDSTSSVASKYGFDPATIWTDPDNAALKKQRTHPNLLLPGDSLAIPARKRKNIGLATGQIHTFKRKGARTLVAVQVFDGDKARAKQEWKLEVGNQSSNGTTDGDGVVEVWVAPTDRTGTLTFVTDKIQLQLDFDHLHPTSESSGVQQRLANLGFWAELPDQDDAERLAAAILSFQVRVGLDPTGKIDDATRTKLVDLHDKRGDLPPEPAIKHKA